MPRILFIAGSSGGHLMPVIAVHDAWKEMQPDVLVHILCTDRREDHAILRRRRVAFTVIPNIRMRRSLLSDLIRNIRTARRILRDVQPAIIFSKGGASGLPLCLLAYCQSIPIVLHESDAVMGRANTLLSRWADVVCLGFSSAQSCELRAASCEEKKYQEHNTRSSKLGTRSWIVTGNPIRPEIPRGSRAEGLRLTGFSGNRPILLVLGGSQGAEALNNAVRILLPELLQLCDVAHITGTGKAGAPPQHGYWSRPFLHEELPHILACTALALSRSGANTIAELAAWGIPTILVPLAGLAQDHQTANARSVEQTGGCLLLQQEMLCSTLVPTIRQLLADPAKREVLTRGMRSFSHPFAARHIAEIIVQTLAHQVPGA